MALKIGKMGGKKDNNAEPEDGKEASGKSPDKPRPGTLPKGVPVGRLLLPGLIAALLLFLLLMLMLHWSMVTQRADQARENVTSAANLLSAQLSELVRARAVMLRLLAHDPEVLEAIPLGSRAELDRISLKLRKRIPDAAQIRVLPKAWELPIPGGATPLGYAGLDMLRRTVVSGKEQAVEVHGLSVGSPHFTMMVPVVVGGEIKGAVIATYPAKLLADALQRMSIATGRIRLLQVTDGHDLELASHTVGPEVSGSDAGTVDVSGTLWQVGFRADSSFAPDEKISLFMASGGVGLLLLIAIAFIQQREIVARIREDMGHMVELTRAMYHGKGPSVPKARLREHHDGMVLMTRYAQRSFQRGRSGVPVKDESESKAAQAAAPDQAEDLYSVVDTIGEDSESAAGVDVPRTVFRTNDIRGVVARDLGVDFARLLGQAVGSLIYDRGGQIVVVGRDVRHSSESLAQAVIDGLMGSGRDVLDLGLASSPLVYFAAEVLQAGNAVVITGSHNASEFNGFKILVDGQILHGEDLLALRTRMVDRDVLEGAGQYQSRDLSADYIARISDHVKLERPKRVVVDGGNGVAGQLASQVLEALGCEVFQLYCTPDPDFPNHHPDPSRPENLAALALEVQKRKADIGVAFDGDGDRLGVVDNRGQHWWPDKILMLLAADVLKREQGADIVYDVKCTRHLSGYILKHGGRPIMARSGHALMREKMRETGSPLGAEFSGHFFIREDWFGFDDAIYAAVRLVQLLAKEEHRRLSDMFVTLPRGVSTPELLMSLDEGESERAMRDLVASIDIQDARIVRTDGLRLEFEDGWGLVRASGTSAALMFRFEGNSEQAIVRIQQIFRGLIEATLPGHTLPF